MKITFTFGRIVPGVGKVITHQRSYDTSLGAALASGPKIERPADHTATRLEEIRAERHRQVGGRANGEHDRAKTEYEIVHF